MRLIEFRIANSLLDDERSSGSAKVVQRVQMDQELKDFLLALESRLDATLSELETRLMAHTENVETRLLSGFWKWARTSDIDLVFRRPS